MSVIADGRVAQKATETAWQDLFELMAEHRLSVLNEYLDAEIKSQPWRVVKKARLVKIWESFVKNGLVADAKGLEKIVLQFVENTLRLSANTELMGHTQLSGDELAEECMGCSVCLDGFPAFITDDTGRWRISDYGLDRLLEYSALLLEAKTDEQKLVLIDLMLNVAHQRSDLASWFVEGGSYTLSEIFEIKERD